jgi:hypothetical protein
VLTIHHADFAKVRRSCRRAQVRSTPSRHTQSRGARLDVEADASSGAFPMTFKVAILLQQTSFRSRLIVMPPAPLIRFVLQDSSIDVARSD